MRKKAVIIVGMAFFVGLVILAINELTLFALCWTLFSTPIALMETFLFFKDELERNN